MNFYKVDFDGIYSSKEYLFLDEERKIVIKSLFNKKIQGVTGYCSKEAFSLMNIKFNQIHMPAITLLGSGNYHYITYILLKRISYPFSLVLFDHHNDMQESLIPDLLSCGNWLRNGLKRNTHLKQVFIFGLGEEQLPSLESVTEKEIHVFPQNQLKKDEWMEQLFPLVQYPIYISIDKDVFDPKVAYTNWDQGTMKEDFIEDFFESIDRKLTLIGGDICGEYPISYLSLANVEYQKRNTILNKKILKAFHQHRNVS